MKKILIITMEFPPQVGGIATYVSDLAMALPPESVVVLAPQDKTAQDSFPFKIYRKKLLSNWFWPHWLSTFFIVWKIIRQEKIQTLMIHHILPMGYVAMLVKWFFKKPYLIFSHGTDIAAASRKPWKRLMVKKICKNAIQIICNSESLKRRFLFRFPENQTKTTVVYPCPDQMFFKPPTGADETIIDTLAINGRKTIISVARMVEGKGFPHLVTVMKQVADQVPNVAWLIIGTGPKLPEIIAQVQKNSLQNIVRFIGEIPHHELPAYFQASTIFTLLTHPDNGQEEGLGLVFLEAAAAGLPCLAGKSGGVDEAVINGKTGLVFDVYQNQKAITDALVFWLNNPDIAKQMGKAGQARMRAEFNWPTQIAKLAPWLD